MVLSHPTDTKLRKFHQKDWKEVDPNAVFLDILGTGGNEIGPSFFLRHGADTYLFNNPEGFHRVVLSYHHPLSKLPLTFYTQASWENIAGCMQYCVGQKDSSIEIVDYCGPRKIDNFFQFFQLFAGRVNNNVGVHEPGKLGHFKDPNISVTLIDLEPSDDSVGSKRHSVVALLCGISRKFRVHGTERTAPSCESEGVIVKDLKTTPSNNSESDLSFLVIDCPSESFLHAVTTGQYLQPEWLANTTGGENDLKLVIHITPLHILQNEAYCKWICSFGRSTKHLLLHSTLCPGEVSYQRALTFSLPFHLMNENVYHFPCPPRPNVIRKNDLKISKYLGPDSIVIGKTFMRYYLDPLSGPDTTNCLEPVGKYIRKRLLALVKNKPLTRKILNHRSMLGLNSSLDKDAVFPSLLKHECRPLLTDHEDALVTILGTSASICTTTRNVSGILIQTLNDGNVLLDCGEGTLQQLYRCFGRSVTRDIIRQLRAIFISHIHIDHHVGTIAMLNEFKALTRDEDFRVVSVIGPSNYLKILENYSQFCDPIQFESFDAFQLLKRPYQCSDNISLTAVKVKHIWNSYGAVLRRNKKWSIVYSGDTIPSRDLIEAGQNADILIHEGTFDEYPSRHHSSYYEALQVGRDMRAGFTLVTHFGYSCKASSFGKRNWAKFAAPTVDLMSVRISDLHQQKLDYVSSRNVFISVPNFMKGVS